MRIKKLMVENNEQEKKVKDAIESDQAKVNCET